MSHPLALNKYVHQSKRITRTSVSALEAVDQAGDLVGQLLLVGTKQTASNGNQEGHDVVKPAAGTEFSASKTSCLKSHTLGCF